MMVVEVQFPSGGKKIFIAFLFWEKFDWFYTCSSVLETTEIKCILLPGGLCADATKQTSIYML